jgi:hypothetical protein
MGASGAIIMSFFGAVFAAMTLATQYGWRGAALLLPFVLFAAITSAAILAMRRTGGAKTASERAERVIMWSSIGEGVGIFLAANLVVNLGHRELLLPAIAVVVGLHFLPMAYAIPFRPFYALGVALLAAAAVGFALHGPNGARVAGFAAATILWVAALLAVRRQQRAVASLAVNPAAG